MLESYESTSATRSQRVSNTLRHTDEVMGMAMASRNEPEVSDSWASFRQDAAELLQLSSTRVVKAVFGRSAFASKRQS